MRILVASSSYYRQGCYRAMLEGLGHEAVVVSGGLECMRELRDGRPELLLLEAPLLWGGSDGVLEVWHDEAAGPLPIVVICANQGSHDWFQLSRFRVDDFLVRPPTSVELRAVIDRCANQQAAFAATQGGPSPSGLDAALPSTSTHPTGAVVCSPLPSVKS